MTNHGYRDGVARPFQATLEAGTSVLVDEDGIARARCACGNPLDEPTDVPGEDKPVDHEPVDEPPADSTPSGRQDFCAIWASVAPGIVGGPDFDTEDPEAAIAAYLDLMVDAFSQLATQAKAESESDAGFPADALTDLKAYLGALVTAAASETGPGAGDPALRDRVENFLVEYCDDEPNADEVPDEDDPADDDTTPTDETPGTSGNCGSMQFWLLVEAAETLGLDHDAVSSVYFEAMDAVLAGADSGTEFDVSDLAPMIAFEEIGCLGATAMQRLFEDIGMGDLIAGTELGA